MLQGKSQNKFGTYWYETVFIQYKNKTWTIFLGALTGGHLKKGGKTYTVIYNSQIFTNFWELYAQ